jgi:hydrogenase maturation protein HypF
LLTGRIQGVGFRPFVYRLAGKLALSGFVYNDTRGVTIELQGQPDGISKFLARLASKTELPPLAEISSCSCVDITPLPGEQSFVIRPSDTTGQATSQVTADMATCPQCLKELADPTDFRHRYPFINCTNCGPRYSIVKTIPYDRPNTTMAGFKMCRKCAAQYSDISDRRFHAQPVACAACGPQIYLTDNTGRTIETNSNKAISQTVRLLLEGKIVAIKGIGGFHLAVDALDNRAVQRLRERKRRDYKPFAMMAADIEKIAQYAAVTPTARDLLLSPQRPIVLLPKVAGAKIAPSVACGVDTFGFMLPYAPLHHLLFSEKINGHCLDALVMTSGNIADEPLICKNDKALERLGSVADMFLMHNREIFRQVDDSVFHLIQQTPVPLRRARGHVPTPVLLEGSAPVDIFAAGADLKNTFCLARGNQFIVSEHIGDLEDAEVYHHYLSSIEHLRKLFEVRPAIAVCDLHPGYLSSRYAASIPGIALHRIQHHWAHIGSVLAEHSLSGPVIGLAADGTGYGTDGTIWGCECLIASLSDFERFGHLDYYPLPGADRAAKEAIRPLLSILIQAYGSDFDLEKLQPILGRIEPDKHIQAVIVEQIRRGINTVATSSLGRVFDAVSAMLGLGNYNHFEAQLPMALEAAAAASVDECYDFELQFAADQPCKLDLRATIRQVAADAISRREHNFIAAKFHNTICEALAAMAVAAGKQTELNTVAISGGVFCNRYLTNRLITRLKENGFSVLFNKFVPANDGGIALGQAAVAAEWAGHEK